LSTVEQLNEDNILSANHQNPAFLLNACYKLAAKNNLVSLVLGINEVQNCFGFLEMQIAR
jgi:hypothetical protein